MKPLLCIEVNVLSGGLRSTESVFENEQGFQTDISNVTFYWKHSL